MNKHEDVYAAAVQKYTLDGANTFILTKHKHKGHTNE